MIKESYVFEFFGLPGCGKTTLTSKLIENIRNDGAKIPNIHELREFASFKYNGFSSFKKYFKFCLFSFKNLFLLISVLRYSFLVKPVNKNSIKYSIWLYKLIFIINELQRKHEIVILEEGIIQKVWGISLTGKPPELKETKKILKKIIKKTQLNIIYIEVTKETSFTQIRKRDLVTGRINLMNDEKLKQTLNTYENHITAIYKEIFKINRSLIKCNNDFQENYDRVMHFISQTRL